MLGTSFNRINMRGAVAEIMGWVSGPRGKCRYVCVTGVHGVMEAVGDDDFRRILNGANLNVPDGMPIVWMGHLAGFKGIGRVFGPDFMLEVCKASVQTGATHYFYGGNVGVAEALAETMIELFPGLKIAGTFCPPFRSLTQEEEDNVMAMINSTHPDVLWVGLGTPKQERWVEKMAGRLDVKAVLAVGAAFDYNTGRIQRAPRWMQQSGLEWMYRLCQEPGRLYKRYLLNNPRFLVLVTLQLMGLGRRVEK